MRVGLYGMPTAGKSYILDRINFIETISGSKTLYRICPNFSLIDDDGKKTARQILAKQLLSKESFIMDGHYSFGDNVVFTDDDGILYDAFLYLYIDPKIIYDRMQKSERNQKYLKYNVEQWQINEIENLREYCHKNNKDFYVIDNPPDNEFDDIQTILEFIKEIVEGYSCVNMAHKCAMDILENSNCDTVILMDGDKTITSEDTSHAVFNYSTHLYDGNFYTGFQAWKQAKEFEHYSFEDLKEIPVGMNDKVVNKISSDTFILTSGHDKIWNYIANKLNVKCYCGYEMSAETKYFITKFLQQVGKKIIAYGDGMNDYFMLKQADEGNLVRKSDSSISRSLKGKDLEGLNLV